MRKLVTAAVVVAAMICAPLALAASSPTVSVSAATGIAGTSATLHGTVNPNGIATTYQFDYGTTNALGQVIPATAASAGAGTTAVTESRKITGLAPDTTYYYELVASNSSGTSTTPVETFKAGNPAPTAVTDPAVGVGRYGATLVGTINPNNQVTTYWFDYGPTDTYGFNTYTRTVPAGTAPVTVSLPLPFIAPGTVFHYRLVASHGSTSIGYGSDVAFQTLPWPRPHSSLSLTVTPRSAKRTPLRVTAHGKVGLSYTTPTAVGCAGTVMIRYYRGSRQVAVSPATVGQDCTYSASTRIGGLGKGRMRLTAKAHYRGDTYAAPSDAKQALIKIR